MNGSIGTSVVPMACRLIYVVEDIQAAALSANQISPVFSALQLAGVQSLPSPTAVASNFDRQLSTERYCKTGSKMAG